MQILDMRCSFCNKLQKDVAQLIVPDNLEAQNVSICSACVEICVGVIRERNPDFCFHKTVYLEPKTVYVEPESPL